MAIIKKSNEKLHIIEAVNNRTGKVYYISNATYILYENFNNCTPISEERATENLEKLNTVFKEKYSWAREYDFFDRTVTIIINKD